MLVRVKAVLGLSFWNMGGQLSELKQSGCCPAALQLGQSRRCQEDHRVEKKLVTNHKGPSLIVMA